MAGFPLPNPTQDPDPSRTWQGLQGLMQAFSNYKPLAPQGQQPLPAGVQEQDSIDLAQEVARAHAESASGGDPKKFAEIYPRLLQQYANEGARPGSALAEAGVGAMQGYGAAKGLYGLGKAGVDYASKTAAGQAVGRAGSALAKDTRGEVDPEKMRAFFESLKDVPEEWRRVLEKKLSFDLLKGKDPFVGKPVPLGPASGSNAATAMGRKDWPELLAKSRSAQAGPTPPVAPTPAPVAPAQPPMPPTPAADPTWSQRLVRSRGIDPKPAATPAVAKREIAGEVSEASPQALRVLSAAQRGPAAAGAASNTPRVFFDTTSPLSSKESRAILSGVRQAIPRIYADPNKTQQLLSRLDNVEKYVSSLGDKASKLDLLQELRKQGMLTKPAYEVLRKMGYSGLKEKKTVWKDAESRLFDEIMDPKFSAADKLK